MPPSKTGGPAPAPSISKKAPASSPTIAAPATTRRVPASPKTFGELYFQPTKNGGETEEDYHERLADINSRRKTELDEEEENNIKNKTSPKLSPGSFTLLTQYDSKGFTGETRFGKESETLQKQIDKVREAINRYERLAKAERNAIEKKIYAGLIKEKEIELEELEKALDTLSTAGGEHYMETGKSSGSLMHSRSMKGPALNQALEQVIRANGEKVGGEVRRKNREEWEEGEQLKQKFLDEQDKLRQELSELRSKARELLKGNLPDNIQDDLHNTLGVLEKILAYDGTGELDIPNDVDTVRMITNIRKLVEGTALQAEQSVLEKTPGEALEEIAASGEEINIITLISHGMKRRDAEDLIALLTKEDILKDTP